jgi:hypothetical protein
LLQKVFNDYGLRPHNHQLILRLKIQEGSLNRLFGPSFYQNGRSLVLNNAWIRGSAHFVIFIQSDNALAFTAAALVATPPYLPTNNVPHAMRSVRE